MRLNARLKFKALGLAVSEGLSERTALVLLEPQHEPLGCALEVMFGWTKDVFSLTTVILWLTFPLSSAENDVVLAACARPEFN